MAKNDATLPAGLELLASGINICSSFGKKPEASNTFRMLVHTIPAQWLVLSPTYKFPVGSSGAPMDLTWGYTLMHLPAQLSHMQWGSGTSTTKHISKSHYCPNWAKTPVDRISNMQTTPGWYQSMPTTVGSIFLRQWNLKVQLEGPQWEFLEKLSGGQGYAVSDESFKDGMDHQGGTKCSFTPNGKLAYTGNIIRPPLLSEQIGRHTWHPIYAYLFPPTTEKPPFQLACDGLLVVSCLQSQWPIDLTEPHADFLTVAKHFSIRVSTRLPWSLSAVTKTPVIPLFWPKMLGWMLRWTWSLRKLWIPLLSACSTISSQGIHGDAIWKKDTLSNNLTLKFSSSFMAKTPCNNSHNGSAMIAKSWPRWIGCHLAKQCMESLRWNVGGHQNRWQDILPMVKTWYVGSTHYSMSDRLCQHSMGQGNKWAYPVDESGTISPTSHTSIGGWLTSMEA